MIRLLLVAGALVVVTLLPLLPAASTWSGTLTQPAHPSWTMGDRPQDVEAIKPPRLGESVQHAAAPGIPHTRTYSSDRTENVAPLGKKNWADGSPMPLLYEVDPQQSIVLLT